MTNTIKNYHTQSDFCDVAAPWVLEHGYASWEELREISQIELDLNADDMELIGKTKNGVPRFHQNLENIANNGLIFRRHPNVVRLVGGLATREWMVMDIETSPEDITTTELAKKYLTTEERIDT